jgi:hypothetical protein
MQSRTSLGAAIAAVLLAAAPTSVAQESAPKRPTKPVYDEKADAKVDLAAATARAAADHKRVLVVFGGNWCGWCVKLHELCKNDAKVSRALLYEYEVVRVDVGRFEKNLDLVPGAAEGMKKSGLPYLAVLDDAAKVVALQDTGSFENGDLHDPKKVLAFLDAQKAAPLDAEATLKAAAERAAREQKLVMVHLGAPW